MITAALVFESYENANSFTVDYKLHAANLPNLVTGKLHVVVEKGRKECHSEDLIAVAEGIE